eukprot:scaffold42424_cov53-Phaeocystis_antarctica.AAC.3
MAAACSADLRASSVRLTEAPLDRSSAAVSAAAGSGYSAAACKGRRPSQLRASGSAPRSSSQLTAAVCPARAAKCKHVRPVGGQPGAGSSISSPDSVGARLPSRCAMLTRSPRRAAAPRARRASKAARVSPSHTHSARACT